MYSGQRGKVRMHNAIVNREEKTDLRIDQEDRHEQHQQHGGATRAWGRVSLLNTISCPWREIPPK